MASLQSPLISPVPQLVNATTPNSVNRNLLFVDFVGLYCKSKRTRRKIGVSPSPSFSSSFSRFANKKKSSCPVNATLSVDRRNISSPSSPPHPPPDLKPQVANLEDIISERGACGVGFIANLENKPSHAIVKDALTALGCMEHRGGCGADNDSGDGSGLMTSIPWELFDKWAESEGIGSFDKLHTGVGMIFFPKDDNLMKEAKEGNCLKWFESG